MSEPQQRFRLGMFVLLSLAVFAGLIFYFGGATRWFVKTNQYTVLFQEAPGVAMGTPVRKSGVKVGEVNAIDLDPNSGLVRVSMRLNSKFFPRTGEEPTITRGLIAGDATIDFFPKNFEKPELGDTIAPGAELKGVSPVNARAIFNQAQDMIPETMLSIAQLRQSMKKFEELAPQIQTTLKDFSSVAQAGRDFIPELKKTNEDVRYFLKTGTRWIEDIGVTIRNDEPKVMAAVQSFTKAGEQISKVLGDDNQKEFARILQNVGKASDKFESLTANADELLKDGRKCFDSLIKDVKEGFKPIQEAIEDGRKVIADIRKVTGPLAEKSEKILNNLEIGSDQFARAIMDVREILRAVAKSEGTLMKFLGDPSLFNNLNDTVVGMQRLMPRLDRILRDVEVFADKIARHPETIGVGGAVRPSGGLKEAPVATPPMKPR